MGLNIDEFHFCIGRIRHHVLLFLTQNPVISCVSLFLLILYMFLPSVFRILLHSFPVSVLIVLAVKLSLDRKNVNNVKIENEPQENNCFPESPMCGSGEKSYKRAHSVRRRNARLKEHFNNAIALQQNKEAATTSNEEVVDKVALLEEVDNNAKEIREVRREIVLPRVEIPKGKNKEDDEIDDEKNSIDIADLSEAERNRRLESLMAKRKARKMLSVQLRKALVKMGKNDPRAQFASILIPKSIPNVPTSPTPGGAPCVLFPTRNPFDIPYDSHEEKPNLSEDGFQKEFVPNQSKDSRVEEHHDTKQMLPNIPPINVSSNVTNEQQEMIKDAIFIKSPASSSKIETTPIKNDTENINIPSPHAPNSWNNNNNEKGLFSTSKEDCHTSIDSDSQVEVSGTTTVDNSTNSHSDQEKISSSSDIKDEGHELREQDIMDVVFSGLEPIYEADIEESESPLARGSISMINHDHQTDKTEQSRKGKSIAEENNNTYEADDIPNTNGKEIIDYIKDTYEEQPSYEPSSSSSSSNNKNNEFQVHRSDQQKEYNPFAASSSHSNVIENETKNIETDQQQQQQQDLQQEMVVGEGSYDSSSSSTSRSSSSTHHDDKIIQTDQNSSNSDKPTNENTPKSDQSTGNSLMPSISNSPENEIQTEEINVAPASQSSPTESNLPIGTTQTSTQETIPCSKDEIEAIKEEEDS